jgi:hypothetical protein
MDRWQKLVTNLDRLLAGTGESRRAASLGAGLKPSALRDIYRKPGMRPTVATLDALARHFNVSADSLYFDGQHPGNSTGAPAPPRAQPEDETVKIAMAVLDRRSGTLVQSPEPPLIITKSVVVGRMSGTVDHLRALRADNPHGLARPDDLVVVDTASVDPGLAGVFLCREAGGPPLLDLYRVQRVPGTGGARLRLASDDGAPMVEVDAGAIVILGRAIKLVAVRDIT